MFDDEGWFENKHFAYIFTFLIFFHIVYTIFVKFNNAVG